MVSVFFLFFLCVFAPKKFTTLVRSEREREFHTQEKKPKSILCERDA